MEVLLDILALMSHFDVILISKCSLLEIVQNFNYRSNNYVVQPQNSSLIEFWISAFLKPYGLLNIDDTSNAHKYIDANTILFRLQN